MEALPVIPTVNKDATPTESANGDIRKLDIYNKFVEFESLPDPDKAAFLGVPMIKEGKNAGRYEKIPKGSDFAVKYGVHINTLTAWKNRPEFLVEVDRRQKAWGTDLVPNVMASLYRRCVRYGIGTDVELFLAYYKQWDRKQVIKHIQEKFDADDIRALLEPLPKDKQDQFYAVITSILSEAELSRGSGEV